MVPRASVPVASHEDNDAKYQLPGKYVARDNPDVPLSAVTGNAAHLADETFDSIDTWDLQRRASGLTGELPDGSFLRADGRILRNSEVNIAESVPQEQRRALWPTRDGGIAYEGEGGMRAYGPVVRSRYPAPNVPDSWAPKGRTVNLSFDISNGNGFWNVDGTNYAPAIPYYVPSRDELRGGEFLGALGEMPGKALTTVKNVALMAWDNQVYDYYLKTGRPELFEPTSPLTYGLPAALSKMTMDDVAFGLVRSSQLGFMMDLNTNPREAAGTAFGFGVAGATGTAAWQLGKLAGIESKAAASPNTVTVFRVEGTPNQRFLIDDAGRVSLAAGDRTIWLNFGETDRATSYFARKVEDNLPGAQLKAFEMDVRFLQEVQANAVPESLSRLYPNRPIISADPFPNQFGIKPNQFQQLLDSIHQGTGKNVRPGRN